MKARVRQFQNALSPERVEEFETEEPCVACAATHKFGAPHKVGDVHFVEVLEPLPVRIIRVEVLGFWGPGPFFMCEEVSADNARAEMAAAEAAYRVSQGEEP